MSSKLSPNALSEVANYYSKKLKDFGECARGVDWNGEDGQHLRFAQLSKLIELSDDSTFSLMDLGCGYGAYLDYISPKFQNMNYIGIDISDDMIEAARCRNNQSSTAKFKISSHPTEQVDYIIASGVFNVRLSTKDEEWMKYLEGTLRAMNEFSLKGFSFNCLTSYSDVAKKRDYLYYPDPCQIFDFCKKNFSRNVALLHDYSLFEFTIIVRK